ncbi:MAG: hypothetical protein K6T63_12050 [Alicyclobacillus herbarius]|uniref:hypothetical protein n=1 Tax=Alicyclobacillus herbarius TaxID=122960 RepID=UPI0004171E1F|nr:hypothetical protein [Alicyclobacillus herbarius]MCL6633350.1 hypothetical protein [Alicyclobacillus herbarius]
MRESQRVPGYRMRNFDEREFVKEYQRNVRRYEVKGGDLAAEPRQAPADGKHENRFEGVSNEADE